MDVLRDAAPFVFFSANWTKYWVAVRPCELLWEKIRRPKIKCKNRLGRVREPVLTVPVLEKRHGLTVSTEQVYLLSLRLRELEATTGPISRALSGDCCWLTREAAVKRRSNESLSGTNLLSWTQKIYYVTEQAKSKESLTWLLVFAAANVFILWPTLYSPGFSQVVIIAEVYKFVALLFPRGTITKWPVQAGSLLEEDCLALRENFAFEEQHHRLVSKELLWETELSETGDRPSGKLLDGFGCDPKFYHLPRGNETAVERAILMLKLKFCVLGRKPW